ncbi:MAG: endonuclease/exonuclease/phosphatase family protein [Pirellulaceae bacterium]
MSKYLTLSVWAYLPCVIAAWLLIRFAGDRWWVATLMLFGPRWLYALPLTVLLPWVLLRRRRLLWLLVPAMLICLFPLAGFCVPWFGRPAASEQDLRILSYNARGWVGGDARLRELIRQTEPDIVAIQEHCGPWPEFWAADWHVYTSNTLVIASPHPLLNLSVAHRIPYGRTDALCCVVQTPRGPVRFSNVHLQSPRVGLEAVLSRTTLVRPGRSHQLVAITNFRREQAWNVRTFAVQDCGAEIIAGDFNMPADSTIYRRSWRDLRNAFSEVGWGFGYTKRSEIPGMTYGARIDHVVATDTWRPIRCWVERDVGSDHLPLIADFARK